MKDKTINLLVEKLKQEMYLWWQKNRKSVGFKLPHEQALYDACCLYGDKEREKKRKPL